MDKYQFFCPLTSDLRLGSEKSMIACIFHYWWAGVLKIGLLSRTSKQLYMHEHTCKHRHMDTNIYTHGHIYTHEPICIHTGHADTHAYARVCMVSLLACLPSSVSIPKARCFLTGMILHTWFKDDLKQACVLISLSFPIHNSIPNNPRIKKHDLLFHLYLPLW